jgi:hypothetical protein
MFSKPVSDGTRNEKKYLWGNGGNRTASKNQGCQIFLSTTYQNWKHGYKICQMSIKYSNILIPRPSKIYPNCFLVCKLPSGNPVWGNDKIKFKKMARKEEKKYAHAYSTYAHAYSTYAHAYSTYAHAYSTYAHPIKFEMSDRNKRYCQLFFNSNRMILNIFF